MRVVVLRLMEHPNCWQCGSPNEESLFCQYCNSLQRPTPDYYRFIGIEPRLRLDANELQQRFYALSRQLHPDHYTRKGSTERQYSLEATAILNDAFRVLRDPVARAEYVLREHGFDIGEQRSKDVPTELLEEVFELNMALEELRGGDESARPQLVEARNRFVGMQQEVDAELERLFEEFDRTQERGVLVSIRGLLNRRRYIRNLISQVEQELAVANTG
jgi:molecular chaperone HscB